MLIIATQSPFSKPLPSAPTNAALMLTQDAVIAASTPNGDWDNYTKVYALDSDLSARGLLERAQLHPQIELVNLAQFVQLTASHHPIMNW